jgi:glutamyl/glutaminyl-tRNA synthetase
MIRYLSKLREISEEDALELLHMNRDITLAALKLLSQRARTLEEFGGLCEYFFLEPTYDDVKLRSKMWDCRPSGLLEAARDELMEMDEKEVFSNPKELKKRMKHFLKSGGGGGEQGQKGEEKNKKKGHQMKDLFLPLRYAISGTNVGADLIETMVLLGKDKCVERLSRVLEDTESSGGPK